MNALAVALNSHTAVSTWAAYDFALTLADEIEYIWKKPVRSGTLIYLWVRYYGLATVAYNVAVTATAAKVLDPRDTPAKPTNLHIYLAVGELLGLILILSVQVILQARVYTIYMSKSLGIFNGAMWITASTLSIAVWTMKHPFSCPDSARHAIVGCADNYPFQWIPILTYQGWIGGLAVRKFVKRIMSFKLEHYQTDLVGIFLKDSVVHYVSINFVILMVNLIRIQTSARSNATFISASGVISASRLVLHLRKAFYEQQTRSRSHHSTIGFQQQRGAHPSVLTDESFWGDDNMNPDRSSREL